MATEFGAYGQEEMGTLPFDWGKLSHPRPFPGQSSI